ncbi:HAMP domain-containing protein [Planktothrix sp. FACHB-1355]|uniref:HAMP domain-containing protein n=1 Tax=Aerosakkonema funiforme FACHB-1375 TaxID=2949571 RepID=A0A926VHK2_9CYAN|nr:MULTISPECIES: HAMP domain-containing protein [Oscillatoriales]MBD2183258.1 HAMP domain-containing protein [Aerosakkonema funiforme FACHB-1375]MBD3561369.1 HAMP domain-containing protein [Planktothrix sp. FACHB-1355]
MQKSQEHGESSHISPHLPNATAFETQKVQPVSRSNQPLLTTFENVCLKTQQVITATTAGIISSLAVVAAIQVSVHIIAEPAKMTQSRLEKTALAGLLTGFTVGGITLALERITTDRMKIIINNLQSHFNAVSRGDLTVRATVDSSKEFGHLAMSFNQMVQLLDLKISEAKQQSEKQAKAKEDLEHKLTQILAFEEFTSNAQIAVSAEITTREDNQQVSEATGTILDFLDHLHSLSQMPTSYELFLGSSTTEEIEKHRNDLEYRQAWLKALLDETNNELNLLYIMQTPKEESEINKNNQA